MMRHFEDSLVPVTVIVRSNNSELFIGQTLEALYSQSFRDFELIICDYSSSDRTRELEKKYPGKRYCVPAKTHSPGQVLNQIIEKSNGEILVFLNADALMTTRGSLWNLLTAFLDPEISAAFGRQIAVPGTKGWVQREYHSAFPEVGFPPDWLPFSMVFGAIRRSVWEARPFSVSAKGAEDFEWGNWAREAGYSIEYVPDASVFHSHNYAPHEFQCGVFKEGDADPFIQPIPMSWFQRTWRFGKHCLNEFTHTVSTLFHSVSLFRLLHGKKTDDLDEESLDVRFQLSVPRRTLLEKNSTEPPNFIKDLHTN